MKSEAQRIAIAEACGWFDLDDGYGRPKGTASTDPMRPIPNYTEDLDAMHEVEAGRYWGETDIYQHHLENVTFGVGVRIWHSTAAQRAEAFLKTIGKWIP